MKLALTVRQAILDIIPLKFEGINPEMDQLLPIISILDQILVFVVGCTLLGYLIVGMLLILSWSFKKLIQKATTSRTRKWPSVSRDR